MARALRRPRTDWSPRNTSLYFAIGVTFPAIATSSLKGPGRSATEPQELGQHRHHHLICHRLAQHSIPSTVKTMLISIVIREKNQRLEVVRGVHCIYQ